MWFRPADDHASLDAQVKTAGPCHRRCGLVYYSRAVIVTILLRWRDLCRGASLPCAARWKMRSMLHVARWRQLHAEDIDGIKYLRMFSLASSRGLADGLVVPCYAEARLTGLVVRVRLLTPCHIPDVARILRRVVAPAAASTSPPPPSNSTQPVLSTVAQAAQKQECPYRSSDGEEPVHTVHARPSVLKPVAKRKRWYHQRRGVARRQVPSN